MFVMICVVVVEGGYGLASVTRTENTMNVVVATKLMLRHCDGNLN